MDSVSLHSIAVAIVGPLELAIVTDLDSVAVVVVILSYMMKLNDLKRNLSMEFCPGAIRD